MKSGPDSMKSGPDSMNSGPDSMESMESRPDSMESGPDSMKSGPDSMKSDPDSMKSMESGPEWHPIDYGAETHVERTPPPSPSTTAPAMRRKAAPHLGAEFFSS